MFGQEVWMANVDVYLQMRVQMSDRQQSETEQTP